MREILAQHAGLAGTVVCALVALVLLLAVARHLRRHRRPRDPEAQSSRNLKDQSVKRAARLDSAELTAAVQDAEMRGQPEKLPGLYLSLAHCRLEAGKTSDAEDLLRKSIRGAANGQHKDVHARARLALGDLAHAGGDLTTACEHWQIARALFFELKQGRDHEAVEMRMLRNGCPTDWVLTDF